MNFLLDTCVISELVAAQPNPRVVEWVDSVDEERLFLSAITIGEVKRGVERLPDSKRKTALQMWLEGRPGSSLQRQDSACRYRGDARWGRLDG